MANKLDCTEKAYEIMMKHTNWRKPKRMTPKRQKAIDSSWKKWKIYRQALLDANLYSWIKFKVGLGTAIVPIKLSFSVLFKENCVNKLSILNSECRLVRTPSGILIITAENWICSIVWYST